MNIKTSCYRVLASSYITLALWKGKTTPFFLTPMMCYAVLCSEPWVGLQHSSARPLGLLPQLSCQLCLSIAFARKDLPFCVFAQTLAFVAFNKVRMPGTQEGLLPWIVLIRAMSHNTRRLGGVPYASKDSETCLCKLTVHVLFLVCWQVITAQVFCMVLRIPSFSYCPPSK